MASLDISKAVCPVCGAKHACSRHASYERYLISWNFGCVTTGRIKITRLMCSSCGATHAILPATIVPYRSYSLFFILTVLRDYFIPGRTVTVENICIKYGISISTFYRFLHLFYLHKQLWLGVLENVSISAHSFLNGLFEKYPYLSDQLSSFFASHGFSFLQGCRKTACLNSG